MYQKTEVTILGQKYVVRSDQGEALLQEVARFVDVRLSELSHQARTSPMSVAVLGALNIANEYFAYRRDMERVLSQIEDRAGRLQMLLETQHPGLTGIPASTELEATTPPGPTATSG